MSEMEFEGEVVDDVEIFDGEPDFDGPQENENGDQDDEIDLGGGLAFFAKTSPVRDVAGMLEWYRTHQTTAQIGFDPDGMCLKVCRVSRNVGPKYLTAKAAQDATPLEHRHHRVRDLRRGMFLYFDDPNDSNRSGHIAAMIGRVSGFDPDDLHDVLVETNSVKANEVVVVRADYFQEHWGDPFHFGATWLNGVVLPMGVQKFESKIEKFQDGGPVYHLNLLVRAGEDRPVAKRVYDAILQQVNSLPDHPNFTKVRRFKEGVRSKEKLLDMSLLNEAVQDRLPREGKIKRVRDEIRRLIASLPDV